MRIRPFRSPLRERISASAAASIVIREFRPSAFRFPWHQHPEAELTWILKGNGLRYAGDSVEPFHAGDFCLLGGNLPHTWLSPAKERGPVGSLVIQFDPQRWGQALRELPEFSSIFSLLQKADRGLVFPPSLGEKLRKKFHPKPPPLRSFTLLLEVLETLAAETDARPLSAQPWAARTRQGADPRVEKILAFLSEHSTEPISHRQAADYVQLSPAAFSRFFRRAIGKTYGEYLTELRLSNACRLMLETRHEISRIAFDVGFENLSTFHRSFRKVYQMAPRDFRRKTAGP